MLRLSTMTHFVLLLLFALPSFALQIFTTGHSTDIMTQPKQIVCLAGGGSDNLWSAGWKALLNASHGGDVVIIRADGRRGGYESWIYDDEDHLGFPTVNSVSSIVIESAQDANSTEVVNLILKSELIFFAGGDQSLYVEWFKNSKLIQAVNEKIHHQKVPVAGTSAGMALLADIDFAARFDSPNPENNLVTSEDVLRNPTGYFVDLDRSVLTPDYMQNVITDTHFSERDREGRLMGFLAKALFNNYPQTPYQNLRGIGADEGTAFCYNSKGQGRVFGAGSVYFLNLNSAPERLEPNQSLSWINEQNAVTSYIIHGEQTATAGFDLKTWTGYGGRIESWWIDGTDPHLPFFDRK
jgi:cyanophycinase